MSKEDYTVCTRQMCKICPLSILLASNYSGSGTLRPLWLVYLLTLSRSLFQVLIKPAFEPSEVLLLPHLLARIYVILLHMNEELLVCFELGSASFLWWPLFPVLREAMSNPSFCISWLLMVLWTSIVFPLSCLFSRMKSLSRLSHSLRGNHSSSLPFFEYFPVLRQFPGGGLINKHSLQNIGEAWVCTMKE